MTDQQVREIDEQLSAFGWTYNSQSEQFETLPRAGAVPSPVAWEDVLAALPDLSLNALMAYEDRKHRGQGATARKAFAA